MPSDHVGGALQRCGYTLLVVTAIIHYSHEANFNLERWKRQSCGGREFQCDSGQCVDQFVICDGVVDCQDGSDETLKTCRNINCPTYAFRCAYGACANADARCNKVQECADGSDEKDCPGSSTSSNGCKNKQFQCKSGICIDIFLLCDGTKDCDDGSDEIEAECKSFTCPSYAFRCDYGACIDSVGKCNGVAQCADRSDEKESMCGTTTTTPKPTTVAPSAGCKLPPQPANGQYKLGGCNPPACQPVPGDSVPSPSFITYTCHSDFGLSGSQFLYCEGGWSAAFPTCSRVNCPALANPSREIECKLNSNKVDFDAPMAPGTKCTVKCNTFYTASPELANFVTDCQANGRWSRDVSPCTPKCGEPNADGVVYVSGGTEAKYGEFPWHVGIYRMLDGSFKQVCGGSIISERVILTAAHCFWDTSSGGQFNMKDFRVAVGKFYRNWDKGNESYTQLPEIQEILLNSRFRGDQIHWQNDIALIKLVVSIQMTIAVRPICLDYEKEQERLFTPGKSGIVMGWGITEKQIQSETIHKATLPYVAFEKCYDEVPDTFRPFLTRDKFCAGYRNGTSVCPGDSGGGYAVQFRDGKWYLMGLVSVGVPSSNADACNIFQYTTFTKVSDFYDFIRGRSK